MISTGGREGEEVMGLGRGKTKKVGDGRVGGGVFVDLSARDMCGSLENSSEGTCDVQFATVQYAVG